MEDDKTGTSEQQQAASSQRQEKKRVKPKHPPEQMPWVLPVNCEGCADCVNRCPQGILLMIETNASDVFVPWMAEVDYCSGCGKCTLGCVMGAIVMTSYVDMATERFLTQKPTINIE